MKICDKTSVGGLIEKNGAYLMANRRTEPWGVSAAAGHRDQHKDPIRAEVREEMGLKVVSSRLVASGWLGNRCRRVPAGPEIGHEWEIYDLKVEGEIRANTRELGNFRWLTPNDLQDLAAVTVARAENVVRRSDFAESPWLEPAWCYWLNKLHVIDIFPADMQRIITFSGKKEAVGAEE